MPQRGFSLIELMVVLAIVAGLATLAYPSYQAQLRRSHQTEARGALLEAGLFLERWYAEKGGYKQDSTTWPALPGDGTPFYEIKFSTSAKNTDDGEYRLRAMPRPEHAWLGAEYLELDQDGNLRLCEEQGGTRRCRR
ncbi:type IV pilin protein [Crenobacter sp. SG2303]|uniref:Type IV pilin protein n=1 Tax=Crenobacter oryzisoli TaxID=3056844 RepID=A0ABT7XLW0_9NEIS|nr:type IV pilin protein [Crenobacter sp. SG2303]MDN0074776.1 type IV pilin protein [Crenobacter sp. SG2303]